MRLIFLGTGTSQGVPVIGCNCTVCRSDDARDKRLRTSIFIEADENHFVIDCGPDFRQQLLNNDISKVDAILMTHEHNDHVIGLDDVRPLNFRQKKDMPIYGNIRTLDELRIRFDYAFKARPYPGAPRLELIPIEHFYEFEYNGTIVESFEVMHGYLPILAYKIGDLVYITDAKSIPERSMELIKGCKVLVINALRPRPHKTHFSLDEALAMIEKIQPERAYLTHMSHLFPPFTELEKTLPKNVFLSYDGLEVKV